MTEADNNCPECPHDLDDHTLNEETGLLECDECDCEIDPAEYGIVFGPFDDDDEEEDDFLDDDEDDDLPEDDDDEDDGDDEQDRDQQPTTRPHAGIVPVAAV